MVLSVLEASFNMADQPDTREAPPGKGRFRVIDANLLNAIDLSRRLGLYVFLPVLVLSALTSLITLKSFLNGLSSGGLLHGESLYFVVSSSVFLACLVLFLQRRRPRYYLMIPCGIVSVAVGIVVFVGWLDGFRRGEWQKDPSLLLFSWVIWFAPLSFGLSLCRYGYLLFKGRS
jgi:hypothetical protein